MYMYPTYRAAIVHIHYFSVDISHAHTLAPCDNPARHWHFEGKTCVCMISGYPLSVFISFSSIIHFCKRSQFFRKLVVVAAATLSGSRSNSTPTHYNLLLLTSFRIVFVITFSHSVVYFVCRWSTTRLCACLIVFLLLLHCLTHTTCAE